MDLEAPEVISFQSYDTFWVKYPLLMMWMLRARNVTKVVTLQGWDFCLAGQGAGEDPTGEKPPREGEVKVC